MTVPSSTVKKPSKAGKNKGAVNVRIVPPNPASAVLGIPAVAAVAPVAEDLAAALRAE